MIDLASLLDRVPVFVLVFFRLAGMMLYAPLFGSARLPRRVRLLLILILALGMTGGVKPVPIPQSTWELAVGIGGEIAFGLAMGMIVSLVFIAAQAAGETIGQQLGLNMAEVFDPAFGSQGSIVGDLYFMLTLVVFLSVNGHHAMLRGVRDSFDRLPLLSLRVDRPLVDMLVGLVEGAAVLCLRLASPVLVTMLVVDLALGLIGRAMPQMNVMQAGNSVKSMIGILVIVIGLKLTGSVIDRALDDSMGAMQAAWVAPSARR